MQGLAVADKEELLKVFDEYGKDTGRFEKRSVVHKTGLYHQEVAVVPLNNNGEILLQKRSINKKSYAGCWALCAGHVVESETVLESAVKEANEELGLSLTAGDLSLLVEKTKNDRDDNKCFATCFLTRIDKPLSYFKRQEEEVDQLAWTSLEKFKQMVESENNCIFKNNEYYQKIISALEDKIKE